MTSHDWEILTTDNKKLAVAKAAGYEFRRHTGTEKLWWRESKNDPTWKPVAELPDFLGDLNVMHKLEPKLGDDYDDYVAYLQDTEPGEYTITGCPLSYWDLFHATAETKAMAFTLTRVNNGRIPCTGTTD